MDEHAFIDGVKRTVRDSAVRSTIRRLEKVGKRPSADELAATDWYRQLDAREKQFVQSIVFRAAEYATLNFLCVLDGVAAIEGPGPKGKLELRYIKGEENVLLNAAPATEELHNLYFASPSAAPPPSAGRSSG